MLTIIGAIIQLLGFALLSNIQPAISKMLFKKKELKTEKINI